MNSDNKIIRRDPGDNGWMVEYKLIQEIAQRASHTENVSMEATEAVVLELINLGFATLGPKGDGDTSAREKIKGYDNLIGAMCKWGRDE